MFLLIFNIFIIAINTKLVFIIIIIWEAGPFFFNYPVLFTINVWPDFWRFSELLTLRWKFQLPLNCSNVPFFWILTFGQIFDVFPDFYCFAGNFYHHRFFQLPPCFWLISFGRILDAFTDYWRLAGHSNYHRFFQMSPFFFSYKVDHSPLRDPKYRRQFQMHPSLVENGPLETIELIPSENVNLTPWGNVEQISFGYMDLLP